MYKLAALSLTLFLMAGQAVAQNYPSKPVRLVVTISAGSTADILARLIAERLSRPLGQPVVVENRPGAGGNVAGAYVAKEPADGHTLLVNTISSHGINPGLYGAKMPYDAMGDFTHVIALASVPNLLIANNAMPASVADLVKLAKDKPGTLAYSSGGNGTSHHLAAELFATMIGTRFTHIPYKGTPEAVTSVVRGDAAFMFPNAPNADTLAKDGRLRALAVTSARRLPHLPEVPTMIELGFAGFEVIGWYGLVGPARMPEPAVRRLNAEVQKILEEPSVRDALAKYGFDVMGGSAEEFRRFNRAEIEKWAKVVKTAGATID